MSDPSPYDEHKLLMQVARGDEYAFSLLFHQWMPFLATHIFRITGNRELTEEIVHDVFLKVWQTRETMAEIKSFKAYLLVISKNHALNALKKMAREAALLKDFTRHDVLPYNNEESDRYTLLDEAIDNLSPRQKEVYLLSRHQRLTYQAIAQKLGIGKESVKTHMELAINNISAFVKKYMIALLFVSLGQ